MGRPRNYKLKERIAKAACALFREQGYDDTSYADIAQACGIRKNLVQYHYPRKELFAIAFMERVLAEAQAALGYSNEDLRDDFGAIYRVGVCYFEYLLREGGYRTFLQDVIRNRDLTERILAFNIQWALERSNVDASHGDPEGDMVRSVVASMGGFYELLYYCLKNGYAFDVVAGLSVVMRTFVSSLGVSDAKTLQAVAPESIDAQATDRAVQSMAKALDA
ncbi:MAG: TetR/AcrR family transcriptional regulator [Eggerthellaceae bacterium]|jgi:AcrR family transcriptional regulator